MPIASQTREVGEALVIEFDGEEAVRTAIASALADGARIEGVSTRRGSLEDLFVREAASR